MKKGILVKRMSDGLKLEIKIVEINSSGTMGELDQIYQLMEVDLIDIVSYKGMSIYVDDEGLLKNDPKQTLYIKDRDQMLFGNLLILGDVNDEGETQGITAKDALEFNRSEILIHRVTGMELIVL